MLSVRSFFAFLFFSTSAMAQTKLAGFVVEINSGKQRVTGFRISSVDANKVTTENNGEFTLVFANAQPGKSVLITAQKDGWQVVNPKELITNLPEKSNESSMKITVCKAGYLEKARKEYYEITDSYITREYNKQLRAINREKEGWQLEAAELYEKLQLLNKRVTEIAQEYSTINLDDLTETERKAVELFKSGDIDSSIKLRESLLSGEKIKTAIATKKQLDSLIAANEHNLKQLANSYILKYNFAKAEKTYEDLALSDTSNFENVFELAYFLANQNKHDKAKKWYLICLRAARQRAKITSSSYESAVALTQINLGDLHRDKNNFQVAELAYLEALEIYTRLAKTNPAIYERNVVMALSNLGSLYWHLKDYPAAQSAYLKALGILKDLDKTDSRDYKPLVAKTFINLGNLFIDMDKYTIAEDAYLSALEIFRRLAKIDQASFEPDVAMTQNNLGILYTDKKNYPAAQSALLEALEIRRRFAKNNPATYEPDVANLQSNLGTLYSAKNNYTAAELAYLEAYTLYKKYAALDHQVYDIKLCRVIVLFGTLQSVDFKLSRQPFIDSSFFLAKSLLALNNDLPETSSYLEQIKSFEFFFITIKKLIQIDDLNQKLAVTSVNKVRINICLEIINEYHSLLDSAFAMFTNEVGICYGRLAGYQFLEKEFANAEKSAREALNPQSYKKAENYDSSVLWVNANLAFALLFQGKFTEAERIFVALKDKSLGKANYKEAFLAQLDELEKIGITHKDIERIRIVLKK